MKFDELKEKYTRLREFALEVQRDKYRELIDWTILLGKCRNLGFENDTLKKKIKALKEEHEKQKEILKKENKELEAELQYNDELLKKGMYNDFDQLIKEKEEKFNSEFPPIEE